MTREEQDYIIETLNNAIEWAEYAPEYFKQKHRLDDDMIDVEKCKELLSIDRTCENCKYWGYKDEKACYEDCSFGLINHSYRPDSFCCNRWEQK